MQLLLVVLGVVGARVAREAGGVECEETGLQTMQSDFNNCAVELSYKFEAEREGENEEVSYLPLKKNSLMPNVKLEILPGNMCTVIRHMPGSPPPTPYFPNHLPNIALMVRLRHNIRSTCYLLLYRGSHLMREGEE